MAEYTALLELIEAGTRQMQSILGPAKSYPEKGCTVEGLAEVRQLRTRVREDRD